MSQNGTPTLHELVFTLEDFGVAAAPPDPMRTRDHTLERWQRTAEQSVEAAELIERAIPGLAKLAHDHRASAAAYLAAIERAKQLIPGESAP